MSPRSHTGTGCTRSCTARTATADSFRAASAATASVRSRSTSARACSAQARSSWSRVPQTGQSPLPERRWCSNADSSKPARRRASSALPYRASSAVVAAPRSRATAPPTSRRSGPARLAYCRSQANSASAAGERLSSSARTLPRSGLDPDSACAASRALGSSSEASSPRSCPVSESARLTAFSHSLAAAMTRPSNSASSSRPRSLKKASCRLPSVPLIIEPSSLYGRKGRARSSASASRTSSSLRSVPSAPLTSVRASSTLAPCQARRTVTRSHCSPTANSTPTSGVTSELCRLRQPLCQSPARRPSHRELRPVITVSAASAKLDFPEPLGPATTTSPGPGGSSRVVRGPMPRQPAAVIDRNCTGPARPPSSLDRSSGSSSRSSARTSGASPGSLRRLRRRVRREVGGWAVWSVMVGPLFGAAGGQRVTDVSCWHLKDGVYLLATSTHLASLCDSNLFTEMGWEFELCLVTAPGAGRRRFARCAATVGFPYPRGARHPYRGSKWPASAPCPWWPVTAGPRYP